MMSELGPILERRYQYESGTYGAEFRLPSGVGVTLEAGEKSVTVGWTTEAISAVAEQLGALAEDASDVYVARDHDISKLVSPSRLSRALESPDGIELVRIDKVGSAVVWAVNGANSLNELSVRASTWEEAGETATTLGAADVAMALPELVSQLG